MGILMEELRALEAQREMTAERGYGTFGRQCCRTG